MHAAIFDTPIFSFPLRGNGLMSLSPWKTPVNLAKACADMMENIKRTPYFMRTGWMEVAQNDIRDSKGVPKMTESGKTPKSR